MEHRIRNANQGKAKSRAFVYVTAGLGLIGIGVYLVFRYLDHSEVQTVLLGAGAMIFSALMLYQAARQIQRLRHANSDENKNC